MTKLMVSCRFIHQVRFGIMAAHALLFVRLYRRRSLVGDPLAVITRGYRRFREKLHFSAASINDCGVSWRVVPDAAPQHAMSVLSR